MHCKGGFDRTGTFIALVNAIISIKEQQKVGEKNPKLSVFSIVRRLREQRFDMVDTEMNYQFIFEAIKIYLESKKILVSEDDDASANSFVTNNVLA